MADNTTLNAGSGGDVSATDEVTALNGSASSNVKVQRVKVTYGPPKSATDVAPSTPLPTFSRHDGRKFVQLYIAGLTAVASTSETIINLNLAGAAGAAVTASNGSYYPASGKRFRVTSLLFAARGHSTATAQVTTFTLRVSPSGGLALSSPAAFSARVATPGTSLAWDRFILPLGDAGLEFVGDGNLSFGVTAVATYASNAPTWDVILMGYEY